MNAILVSRKYSTVTDCYENIKVSTSSPVHTRPGHLILGTILHLTPYPAGCGLEDVVDNAKELIRVKPCVAKYLVSWPPQPQVHVQFKYTYSLRPLLSFMERLNNSLCNSRSNSPSSCEMTLSHMTIIKSIHTNLSKF